MKTLQLSKNQVTFVDDDCAWADLKWSASVFGYAVRNINGKLARLHRLIIGAAAGELVDHINGNRLDNRRSNLRIVTPRQNCLNRRKTQAKTSSRFKGVRLYIDKRKKNPLPYWVARIKIGRTDKLIGYFRSEIQAAMAYDIAARDVYKEYAKLNF